MLKRLNLIGKKFSRLFVIADIDTDKWGNSQWLCKCDCGNETIVRGENLIKNRIKSCGCFQREMSSETRQKMSEAGKGNKHAYKHGMTGTKAYRNQINARYKACKRNQTPPDANKEKIQEIYNICACMNYGSTNIKWHVDHIYPLSKGGLHHEDNLRILEAGTNHRKSNQII